MHHIVKKFQFLLGLPLFFLCHSPSLQSQELIKFTNLTIDDGLSHSKVNCIYQDSRGFMWFGTNEGLDRFDGFTYKVFRSEQDDPGSLSANLIRCIIEDTYGNLLVGTEGGGLNLFDRRTQSFSHFTMDTTSEVTISGHDVNAIIDDDSVLWLATENGIDCLNLKKREVFNYLPYPPGSSPLLSNELVVLCQDRQKTIWVGTVGGGLCAFDRQTRTFTCIRTDSRSPAGLSDNEIRSIYEDTKGRLWIGTTNGGLNLLDRSRNRFVHYHPSRYNPESTTIRAIIEDGNGNLWVGNRSGLYLFHPETGSFTEYVHDSNNPYSLVQNSVWTIHQDAKGDFWIGTRGGISYMDMSVAPFLHYRADAGNRKCLNKQAVYAILQDRRGDLWFGTEHGGLNYLNRKTGFFTYYTYQKDDPHSISVNNIKTLLEDRKGNLWVGTFNGGLNRFNLKTRQFSHYFHRDGDTKSLASNHTMALLEDKKGRIWIGMDMGGLDCYDPETGETVHILTAYHDKGFFSIHCLLLDAENKLWICGNQSRVGCLDLETGAFEHFRLDLPSDDVEIPTAYQDKNGIIWFGTAGSGLYGFDPATKKYDIVTINEGLPSNTVYGILEDTEKNLWLSTTHGLCRYNPGTGAVKNYFKENGLQSNQFNYNCCLKTRDGQMFFGGINGVTAFYPEAIHPNQYVPPVIITDFKISNRSVGLGDDRVHLAGDISETGEIHLSYRQTVFSFDFVALNYSIPQQNQYAYKMEGFDNGWNHVGSRRFANYTNLNPGSYTFKVIGSNNDGVWNQEGASVKILISPPFWRTLYFKGALLALMLLTIKHFIDYTNQKKNLLKALALANLSQLKLLRNQMNPHFLFNALGSIRSMILISGEKAWDMVSELSEFFRYTLLNFNKVEALLDDEISAAQNYLHIEKVRYQDSLQVSFEIEDDARKCMVPAFICQPLIENAIKYGMQTSAMPLKVDIAITYQNNALSIDVSNTGHLVEAKPLPEEEPHVHGTSLENIKKRLGIMFRDRFSFQLFESDGWVHNKILIHCEPDRKGRPYISREELSRR
ncbi:MAG: histidine kinase [Syntrophaceae bacterium]|nr:histidine kinase [Syntrophaceae bacterium]